ncbi:MAG: PilZ domain-containing protein [Treponema sp.]|nr:PilZ domain-containing protein [Treponema sp.]
MSDEQTTAEKPQAEINGKKIFFLYPTASVINQVITELAQHEYEVYVGKDHTRLARALKKYPDSIVFVNIDDRMPESEWEKWIATLISSVPTVKVGIFSSSTDEELKNKYTNKLKISCGFMTLKLDMTKTAEVILEVLKTLDVKGRRKYLRASTEREANATVNMPLRGDFINGTIKDISVVGFSCVLDHNPELSKNALHKDIQIRLQSMLLKVEAVVFGSRSDGIDKTYVLIFTQRTDPDVRVKIRKYIQGNLQSKMDNEIN